MAFLRLDPRTIMCLTLWMSIIALISNDRFYLISIFIIALMIALILRADVVGLLFRIRKFLPVLLAIILMQIIFNKSGDEVLRLGNVLVLYSGGLESSLIIGLRICVFILSAIIINTQEARALIQALVQMRIPYEIAFMSNIAIRFLPMLKEEINDTMSSIQLRGLDIYKLPLRKRLDVYSYVFIPVLAGTIAKARSIAIAMELRGFRMYPNRTSLFFLTFTAIDYFVIGMSSLLGTIALIYLYS